MLRGSLWNKCVGTGRGLHQTVCLNLETLNYATFLVGLLSLEILKWTWPTSLKKKHAVITPPPDIALG